MECTKYYMFTFNDSKCVGLIKLLKKSRKLMLTRYKSLLFPALKTTVSLGSTGAVGLNALDCCNGKTTSYK